MSVTRWDVIARYANLGLRKLQNWITVASTSLFAC